MKTHNFLQGEKDWHEFRANHFGASEAAAMLGISPYMSRTELLHLKATGEEKQHSDHTQRIFQKGHDVEEKARILLEKDLGAELYTVTCSEGKLSASCDGLTLDGSIAFEHKQFNKSLFDSVLSKVVPDHYMAQCQQILMVTGSDKIIFVCSDGTRENWAFSGSEDGTRERWAQIVVYPDKKWFDRIKKGWRQFERDLVDYKPMESKNMTAEPIMKLPALSIQIKGEVIASNLPEFKEDAERFIANINTDLRTDEDFVNAEATVKFCKDIEDSLKQAKDAVINQSTSINDTMRTIDYVDSKVRKMRLYLDKEVKSEKEKIRLEIISEAKAKFSEYIKELEKGIEPVRLEASQPDFISVMKNKRTLQSLHNEADSELALKKIEADELADHVRTNLECFNDGVGEYRGLFRDLQQIIYKDHEDFKILMDHRVKEHMSEEKRRQEYRQTEEERMAAIRRAKEDIEEKTCAKEIVNVSNEKGIITPPENNSARQDKMLEIAQSLNENGIDYKTSVEVARLIINKMIFGVTVTGD